MNTENIILLRSARESLKDKWALAIGTFLIYTILISLPGSARSTISLVSLIIGGPFALGAAMFSLSIARDQEAQVEQIFQGFNRFTTAFIAFLLLILYITLWLLLLIVPGIIAALSYNMTFYIIADDPLIKPEEALRKSKTMMYGYKSKLFNLYIRFFLLGLICILTLGIGFLWLIPYAHVTLAKFYDDIKGN